MAARFNVTALVMFIAVGLLAGVVSPIISDAIGVTGLFATMIFLTIFFVAIAYIGKEKLGVTNFLWFVVLGILAMFINSFVTEALGWTSSAIMTSVLFCVIFFVVLTYTRGKRAVAKR